TWDTLANVTPRDARAILLHELFHGVVQARLGLKALEMLNEHLDAVDGRYWMRLEWRALAGALRPSGTARQPPSAMRLRARVWPPARRLVPRLEAADPQCRRFHGAPGERVCGSAGRRRRGGGLSIRRRRDPRRRGAA